MKRLTSVVEEIRRGSTMNNDHSPFCYRGHLKFNAWFFSPSLESKSQSECSRVDPKEKCQKR